MTGTRTKIRFQTLPGTRPGGDSKSNSTERDQRPQRSGTHPFRGLGT